MAEPISSEEFHDELMNLVAECASKAIRGVTGDHEGMAWEDAARFIALFRKTQTYEFYTATDYPNEPSEFAAYVAVKTFQDDEMDDEDVTEHKEPLSSIVLRWREALGEDARFVREYRDSIAASLAKLDEWLSNQSE
jgi:hypothetical protein